MNLASIVPPTATSTGTGKASARSGAKAGSPAGFLDVLASKFTGARSSATKAAGGSRASAPAGVGDARGAEVASAAQELLTLAALASRTAHAALPQLAVTAGTDVAGEIDADVLVDALLASVTADVAEEAVATTIEAESAADGEVLPAPIEDPASSVPVDGGTADVDQDAALTVSRTTETPVDVDPAIADDAVDAAVVDVEAVGAGEVAADDAAADVDTTAPAADDATAGDDAAATPTTATTTSARTEGAAHTSAGEPADEPSGQRAVPAAPADRGRGRADQAAARVRVEGAGTIRAESVGAPAPTAPGSVTGAVRIDAATPSAAAQRVLDLVTQLEDAPPPRVVVIDTGEIRVRLGLDAGTVRMTVLGPLGEAGEELLREAADALEAGGFGTELDRGADGEERGGDRAARDDRPAPATPASPRRPAAASRAGLQL